MELLSGRRDQNCWISHAGFQACEPSPLRLVWNQPENQRRLGGLKSPHWKLNKKLILATQIFFDFILPKLFLGNIWMHGIRVDWGSLKICLGARGSKRLKWLKYTHYFILNSKSILATLIPSSPPFSQQALRDYMSHNLFNPHVSKQDFRWICTIHFFLSRSFWNSTRRRLEK